MNWPLKPFDEAVEDITGGQEKVQKSEYQSEGDLPVIDQGQQMIAGYIDDVARAYQGPLPVVLFGDHTRIFKYVDHPFALGADGVKVLAPRGWLSARFLYYYFQSFQIPSRGYSRHFKFLRERQIPDVQPDEQRRIVEILDQADALRKLRREADQLAERILPALFYKMFGDPVRNEKGWESTTLDQVAEIVTGNTPSREQPDNFGEEVPWARPADLEGQLPLTRTEQGLSIKGAQVARVVSENSVLVCCIGATLGKVGLAGSRMAINQQINALLPSSKATPEFLYVLCLLNRDVFRNAATQQTLPILNKSRFGQQKAILPPMELQGEFSERARELIQQCNWGVESRVLLEKLFAGLLHRAFTGELTEGWRGTT